MEPKREIIETRCIAVGDGENFESVLCSDQSFRTTGHTQTEAVDNLVSKLKSVGRFDPTNYSYRY